MDVARADKPELADALAEALRVIEALTLDNARLRAEKAERDAPPEWLALKSCDRAHYSLETLRAWCIAGLVDARREGARWIVNTKSLADRLKRLAAI